MSQLFADRSFIDIGAAETELAAMIRTTPLVLDKRLSDRYSCQLYLKREDLQPVRSYKLRGAYNKIKNLVKVSGCKEVVCASAGNHAQGVAYSCVKLGLKAHVFMPENTPDQKLEQVKVIGGAHVNIILKGENFDEASAAAVAYAEKHALPIVPPFDDPYVIAGQGTIAAEILKELTKIDFVLMPVGGGGLAAGICHYFHQHSPGTAMIGVEPEGAASMTAAFEHGGPVCLEKIDPFVDGAAVRIVGKLNYEICREAGLRMLRVPEGKVCSVMLELFNRDGILTEPAGALSIAALDQLGEAIRGKTVVCILSGSNHDSNRMDEIRKLAHAWEGLQHHLVIRFPHHPDGLKLFFTRLLGKNDYVNRIEYMRRDHGRSTYALLGIRCHCKMDFDELCERLRQHRWEFKEVMKDDFLFKYWV